jgi:hypothetical protein
MTIGTKTAGLISESAGNLSGTSYDGGATYDASTVFELIPDGNGQFTEPYCMPLTESTEDTCAVLVPAKVTGDHNDIRYTTNTEPKLLKSISGSPGGEM